MPRAPAALAHPRARPAHLAQAAGSGDAVADERIVRDPADKVFALVVAPDVDGVFLERRSFDDREHAVILRHCRIECDGTERCPPDLVQIPRKITLTVLRGAGKDRATASMFAHSRRRLRGRHAGVTRAIWRGCRPTVLEVRRYSLFRRTQKYRR